MKPFKDEDYYCRIQIKNIHHVFFFLYFKMIDFQLTVKSLQSSVPMHHQNNESQIEPVDLRPINQSKALFLPLKLYIQE